MNARSPGSIAVGRLVARGTGRDALATRLRLEAGLGVIDLRHTGLPPDAILCVRHLTDPAPRRFRIRSASVSPPAEWLMAVERRLEQLARQAARPALAPVQASAEAVLFYDRAELLAALATAWAGSARLDDWWWRRLLPAGTPREVVVATWQDEAASIPAALDRLAHDGMLAPFLGRLDGDDVARVAEALLQTYGLPTPTGGPVPYDGDDLAPRRAPAPPWSETAPEVAGMALPPGAALLTGIGLTLARRPGLARAAGFAAACDLWLRWAVVAPGTSTMSSRADAPAPDTAAPSDHLTSARLVRPNSGSDDITPRPTRLASDALWPLPPPPGAPSPPAMDVREPRPQEISGTSTSPGEAVVPTDRQHAAEGIPESAVPIDWGVFQRGMVPTEMRVLHSSYGGTLFLANVALALDLYPDFTRPGDRGLPMEFWAFILGLAARLLEEAPVDPFWTALRVIAGEEGDQAPPGPDAWRIPPEWRDLGEPRRAWDAWWAAAVPYIRYRLTRALDLPDGRNPADILLRQPARVELSATSIYAVFVLERHPIEIRLAGLDRDPGWIPAAGRAITFGFDLTTA